MRLAVQADARYAHKLRNNYALTSALSGVTP